MCSCVYVDNVVNKDILMQYMIEPIYSGHYYVKQPPPYYDH